MANVTTAQLFEVRVCFFFTKDVTKAVKVCATAQAVFKAHICALFTLQYLRYIV